MKTNNISLSQTKSGQRYTYTLLNTKLPKSNGSREFGGNGDGGLELQNYLQEYIDNGWRLIQLELVTLNVSSQTHDVLKTIATQFDDLINTIGTAQSMIDAEQLEYKNHNGIDYFDSEINALNSTLRIRKRELIEMRNKYRFSIHMKSL
jgi:hypothetical protein